MHLRQNTIGSHLLRNWRFVVCALFLQALCTSSAQAITIQFEVSALGGENYRYSYQVNNDASLGDSVPVQLFSILFDPSFYQETSLSISSTAEIAVDWDELILGSGVGFPAAYDALSNTGGIAVGDAASGFSVDFVWLGGGDGPGEQVYQIFDPASFALLEEGVTVPLVVPLPASLWLALSGMSLLFAWSVPVRSQKGAR